MKGFAGKDCMLTTESKSVYFEANVEPLYQTVTKGQTNAAALIPLSI